MSFFFLRVLVSVVNPKERLILSPLVLSTKTLKNFLFFKFSVDKNDIFLPEDPAFSTGG